MNLPSKFLLFIVSLLLLISIVESRKLIMVQAVVRHGARYPEHLQQLEQANISTQGMALGQLTTNGKKMHYVLGKKFYSQYWKKLFHNEPYNHDKYFYKSSNLNRTIESAQSDIMGFFQHLSPLKVQEDQVEFSRPPWPQIESEAGNVFPKAIHFHPTAIHVQKQKMSYSDPGDFLVAYYYTSCKNQKIWQQQNYKLSQIKDIFNDQRFTDAIQQLQNEIGSNKDLNFTKAASYYDTFLCLKFLGRQKDFFQVFLDKQTERTFRFMLLLKYYIGFFYTQTQIKASATGIFNATIQNIKNIKNPRAPQWIYYSAHDLTVMNMFAAMNVSNTNCVYDAYKRNLTTDTDRCIFSFPTFAVNLIFEIYQQTDGQMIIKMRYNGIYRLMPFCEWKYECPVETFYDFYEKNIEDKNFVQTCGIKQCEQTKTSSTRSSGDKAETQQKHHRHHHKGHKAKHDYQNSQM